MSDQEQFLDVIDRDEAERRFRSALTLAPLGIDKIAVRDALGRVLASNVIACVDVPSFDRSNFDGYAIRAVDTQSASELVPQSVDREQDPLGDGWGAWFLQCGHVVPSEV